MKLPQRPPDYFDLVHEMANQSPKRFVELISLGIPPDPRGRYYHWDKLRYLSKPPHELTHEEWWFAVKSARKTLYKQIPHTDRNGYPFVYGEPDIVRRLLHEIDIHGGGEIKSSEPVANPHTRDTYLINSLIEEAITSSQLEGAATTRKVAKEMLRQNRKPRDRSERMIVNNYHAMQFINDIAEEKEELTPEIILELHHILSEGTIPDHAVGNLRTSDDVYVSDMRDATVLHIPPKAIELPRRLENICDFANTNESSGFLHPIVRAILLHFLLAYDHPFEDGNGRTARALFYWSTLKQGYWTMEFISISRILRNAPAKYVRSYLYTETDDNDVTYFIVYQLEVILKAINDLFVYLDQKATEIKSVEILIRKSPRLLKLLNHRQIALISRAIKKPDSIFYIESHRGAHNVTYDTARNDLLKLVDLGILKKSKLGKAYIFLPTENVKKQLQRLSQIK